MTRTIEAPFKPINGSALAEELQAAAGEASQGWSAGAKWPGVVRLHFADDAPQAVIDAAMQAYAAHDPAVLTADQQAEADRAAAVDALRAADLAGMRAAAGKAGTLSDTRALLVTTLDLLDKLLLAAGLTGPARRG